MPAVGLMAAPTVATGQTNPLEQLKRLKSLLDIDAITQQEYDQKKKELLELVWIGLMCVVWKVDAYTMQR